MFIEQGNLFNSINFNLPPETPGMAGAVPFMPAYQNPEPREHDGLLDTGRDFTLPVGRTADRELAGWEQLPRQPADLGVRPERELSEHDRPQRGAARHLLLQQLRQGRRTLPTASSNTAYFSEKIRGNGTPNPQDGHARLRQPDVAQRHVSRPAQQLNVLTAPPLTSRQGMSWVMGEMCCSLYNHVAPPNKTTCAATRSPATWPTWQCRCPRRAIIPAESTS